MTARTLYRQLHSGARARRRLGDSTANPDHTVLMVCNILGLPSRDHQTLRSFWLTQAASCRRAMVRDGDAYWARHARRCVELARGSRSPGGLP